MVVPSTICTLMYIILYIKTPDIMPLVSRPADGTPPPARSMSASFDINWINSAGYSRKLMATKVL